MGDAIKNKFILSKSAGGLCGEMEWHVFCFRIRYQDGMQVPRLRVHEKVASQDPKNKFLSKTENERGGKRMET